MSSKSLDFLLSGIRSQDGGLIRSADPERSEREAESLLRGMSVSGSLGSMEGREEGIRWLFLHLFHSDMELREELLRVLSNNFFSESVRLSLWSEFSEKLSPISSPYIIRLSESLTQREDSQPLRITGLFINVLGKNLRCSQGTAVINALLNVIEKGFKGTEDNRLAAFTAWRELIHNFALPPSLLSQPRRSKLIVRPLMSTLNAKTEKVLKLKIEVWWEFLLKMEEHLLTHVDSIVIPFLEFNFGKLKDAGAPTPHIIQSPVRKFPSTGSSALDAFYRLVVPNDKVEDVVLPYLPALSNKEMLTPKVLRDHNKVLFFSLEKSAELIKFGNHRSLQKFRHIFDALSDALDVLFSEEETEVNDLKKIAYHYSKSIQTIIFENKRKPHILEVLYHILDKSMSIIPNRFIFYSHHSQSILQIFLDVLCHVDFIEQSKEYKNIYANIFSKLLDKSPQQAFLLIQKVSQRVFSSSPEFERNVSGSVDIWQVIWRNALGRLKKHAEQTMEINESLGSASIHNLDTVKTILLFPIQNLIKTTNKEFWNAWGDFYSLCIRAASTIISYESLELEAYISSRALEHLRKEVDFFSSHQVFIFNNYCRIAQLISNSLILDNQTPFKNLESFMDLLSELVSMASKKLIKVGGIMVGVTSTVSSLMHVLCHLTPSLLMPVIQSSTRPIISMLGSNFLSTYGVAFEVKMDALIDKLVTSLNTKFDGESPLDLLNITKPLLLAFLGHSKKTIRGSGHLLWQQTFSKKIEEANIPNDILSVLRKNSIIFSDSSSSISSSMDSFPEVNPVFKVDEASPLKPGSLLGKSPLKTGSLSGKSSPLKTDDMFLSKSSPLTSPSRPPPIAPNNKSPFAALKKNKKPSSSNINDEDTQDFVPIINEVVSKERVLTEHQKEILKARKDDIPALYSELSRDESISQPVIALMSKEGSHSLSEVKEEQTSSSQSLLFNNEETVQKTDEDDKESSASDASKVLKEKKQGNIASDTQSSQEDIIESSQSRPSSPNIVTRKRKRPPINYSLTMKRTKLDRGKKIANNKENKESKKEVRPTKKLLNHFGESQLQIAIKKGNLQKVAELLKNDADVNHRCNAGWTPLHDAIKDGEYSIAIIKLLLDHGSDINAHGGEEDNTPLHEAVLYCSADIVQLLIARGANPNAVNKSGQRPLDVVASDDIFKILNPLTSSSKSKEEKALVDSLPIARICLKKTEHPPKPTTEYNQNDKSIQEKEAPSSKTEKIPSESLDTASPSEDESLDQKNATGKDGSEAMEQESSPQEEETKSVDSLTAHPESCQDAVTEVPESMEISSSVSPEESSNKADKLISLPKPNIENGDSENSDTPCKDYENGEPSHMSSMIFSQPSGGPPAKATDSPLTSLHKSRAAKLLEMSKAASLVKRSDSAKQHSPQSVLTPPAKPWQKFFPSPNASPTTSILKRRYSDFSPSNNSRKVQFSDPPVSEKVEIPRKTRFNRYSADHSNTYSLLGCLPQDNSLHSSLGGCQEPVSCLLQDLTTRTWLKTAEKDFKEKNIQTVGDLAKLTESEASQLKGMKPPVILTLRDTLQNYEKTYKRSEDDMVSKALAPFVEVQTPEEEEKNMQEIYERPSPSPTEDAAEAVIKAITPPVDPTSKKSSSIECSSQTTSPTKNSRETQSCSPAFYDDKVTFTTDSPSLGNVLKELLLLDKSTRWAIANEVLTSLQKE